MSTYTSFGPGDPITWGSPVGHPLDPRNSWEPGDDAEEYCPATCPELNGIECFRHNTFLDADALGTLRCTACFEKTI